jgi:hypothetical protein
MVIFLILLPAQRIYKSKTYTVSLIRFVLQPNKQPPVGDKIYHRQSRRYMPSIQKHLTEMYWRGAHEHGGPS